MWATVSSIAPRLIEKVDVISLVPPGNKVLPKDTGSMVMAATSLICLSTIKSVGTNSRKMPAFIAGDRPTFLRHFFRSATSADRVAVLIDLHVAGLTGGGF